MSSTVQTEPLAYDMLEVQRHLAIGRTFAYQLVREGKLRSFKVGRRLLVSRESLNEFIRSREASSKSE